MQIITINADSNATNSQGSRYDNHESTINAYIEKFQNGEWIAAAYGCLNDDGTIYIKDGNHRYLAMLEVEGAELDVIVVSDEEIEAIRAAGFCDVNVIAQYAAMIVNGDEDIVEEQAPELLEEARAAAQYIKAA